MDGIEGDIQDSAETYERKLNEAIQSASRLADAFAACTQRIEPSCINGFTHCLLWPAGTREGMDVVRWKCSRCGKVVDEMGNTTS